ncbi:hypothetical protein [Spirillospora sp. CA-294931]
MAEPNEGPPDTPRAEADTARADLASLAGKVQDLMRVARVQEDQRSM